MWACVDDLDQAPAAATKSISSRVARLDRAARISVLIAVLEEADAEHFWSIFLLWWSDFEFPHSWEGLPDRLRDLHAVRPAYRFLPAADQAFFDNLPNQIIVHRGASANFPPGISWTTDEAKAVFFARRFAGVDATVFSGTICKRHVWAVFTGRNESEILCDPVKFGSIDARLWQLINVAQRALLKRTGREKAVRKTQARANGSRTM